MLAAYRYIKWEFDNAKNSPIEDNERESGQS
jgi:hypothetical protein